MLKQDRSLEIRTLGKELFIRILENMNERYHTMYIETARGWDIPEDLDGALEAFLHEYVEAHGAATGNVFFNNDDITSGVREKIYCLFAPIAWKLAEEHNVKIEVVIEPFYDDWSSIYFLAKGSIGFVIYERDWKTYHPLFLPEPESIFQDIEEIYRKAEENLKRCLALL